MILEELAAEEDRLLVALEKAEAAKMELERRQERANHLRRAIEELEADESTPGNPTLEAEG